MANDSSKIWSAFTGLIFSIVILLITLGLVFKLGEMTGGEYSTKIMKELEDGKFLHAIKTTREACKVLRYELVSDFRGVRSALRGVGAFPEARATQRVVFFCAITLFMLWMIGALFGGAISRAAAVEFATGKRLSLLQARSFAGKNFGQYFWPPIILIVTAIVSFILIWVLGKAAKHPISALAIAIGIFATLYMLVLVKQKNRSSAAGGIAGVVTMAVFIVLAYFTWQFAPAWLSRISAFAMFPIAILLGIVALIAILVMLFGCGLVRNSVSYEATDSIDAISRGSDYLFKRPWLIFFYGIIALVYGSICVAFMSAVIGSGIFLALAGFQTAFGTSYDALVISHARFSGVDYLAFTFITLAVLFILSWIIVFIHCFWSVCYALIRRSVDQCDLNEIYLEGVSAPENK